MLGSHLWYTEDNHSVILCTGQERDKYIVAVRFTSEHITPVKNHGHRRAHPRRRPARCSRVNVA